MKNYPHILVRIAIVALLLGAAPFARAACDLKIVSAVPCLAGGSAGNPSVGDNYGLKLSLNITGTPSAPFDIVFTMANISFTNTFTHGAGNWALVYDWALDLDDPIPWSIQLDPAGVSGNTNPSNTVSGTFTPTPPITATDLFDPIVWNGSESYLLTFEVNPSLLYVVFGDPTTHGAQTVLSVDGPSDAELIVTAPYNLPIFQTTFSNSSNSAFSDTNNFVMQLSRTRVNPNVLRTNTWADMSGMATNWTVWLAPDARCESTNPLITSFVQTSLPTNYLSTLTPYDTARTLHKAVMKALRYEEPPPAIDAVGVLEDGGIADCGGYSALLVASLRNVGIPARCISGFRQGEQIPHVRVEFHLPGTEWIVADPTDGNTNDPTGTYAYDFGITSDGNRYVAVDAGDAHILPYYTFEFIQIPNPYAIGGTSESYTSFYALVSTPSVAVEASPSDAATVTGEGAYTAGTSVQIAANANTGWMFTSWTDGNTQNPRTVTVPEAGTNYIASFVVAGTTPSNTCTYALSPASTTLTEKGGTKTVSVKVKGTDCSWTAVSNDPFITIISGSNGTASGKVEFTVPGNTNTTALSGTMTIAGETYTVNQAAGGCTYKLSPKDGKLKSTGGTATIKVTPNLSDCTWAASSGSDFITILSGASGTGKGTVTYSVPTNATSTILTGSIAVAGETFTVIQAGVK